MELSELITALETELRAGDRLCAQGFENPHSYRGDYHQLAFEPARNVTISAMLASARSALDTTYEGYKGGNYTMFDYTECWLAEEGSGGGETIGPLVLQAMTRDGTPVAESGKIDVEITVDTKQFVEAMESLAEALAAMADAFVVAADRLRNPERTVETVHLPPTPEETAEAERLLGL